MKTVTNCKNCGAPLDIMKPHCEFCGTKNVNLTALDLASGEAANFIIKLPNSIKVVNEKGQDIYMTILAIPSLESFTTSYDTVSVYGGYGSAPLVQVDTGASIEMGLKLSTVCNPKSSSLCELWVGEEP
jgi:hypothetical protein